MGKQNSKVIEEVIDYIENHLSETLTMDKIANVAGYSKFHLSRIFKDYVGCSLYQYIQRRRLTEAARLLIDTNMNITDISLIAGYDTQQAFTIAFRKSYQTSPRVYRTKSVFSPLQIRPVKIGNISDMKGMVMAA